jgi:hypothetical protein
MANLLFVEKSEKAIDPDHVVMVHIPERVIVFTSGRSMQLSPEDFAAVLKAKEGK